MKVFFFFLGGGVELKEGELAEVKEEEVAEGKEVKGVKVVNVKDLGGGWRRRWRRQRSKRWWR